MPHTKTKRVAASITQSYAQPKRAGPSHAVSSFRLRAGFLSTIPATCLFLALATAAIYAPIVKYDFVNYDDDVYVYNNSDVTAGLTWQTVRWAFTTDAAGNWHPLTWLSHSLDCQLWGIDHPGGHHATSLLLHVLNALLLFLFFSWVTGARGRSLVVAGLFALHPFNVESVAWIGERKNVLCMLFFLLALLAYGWYAQNPGVRRYLCVAALFALGLASKPMVITLPLVLLLLDFWPLGRVQDWSRPSPAFPLVQTSFRRVFLEKIPLLALSGASAVITVIAQRRGKSLVSFSESRLLWRFENALWAYSTYLWKALFPRGLAPFYPAMPLRGWQVILAAAVLSTLGWLTWKFRSGRPYLVVGCLWFFGTLVPVIGIVQVGTMSMADRYAYIPLIGIFVAVVWGAFAAACSVRLDTRWLAAAAALVLVGLALATSRQVSYWKDSIDLWSHAARVTVTNYVAEEDLAVALANAGRDDEALPHFFAAKEIRPNDPTALMNLGINLEQHGRHEEAIQQFEAVIRTNHDPDRLTEAHRRIGIVYAHAGDRVRSRTNLLQALQFSPDDPVVIQNLSMLAVEDGVDKLSRLVLAHPTAQGYFQLGQLLEADRNVPQAQKAYEHALKLDPGFADAVAALNAIENANKQN